MYLKGSEIILSNKKVVLFLAIFIAVCCFSKKVNAKSMYTKETCVMFRDESHKEIIMRVPQYKKVKLLKETKKWYRIRYNLKVGYVRKSTLTRTKPYKTKSVPSNSFKSYMSYKAITDKSSPQYQLQQQAVTGKYGIRTVNGRYCIAMGSYYCTKIGTKIDLVMSNGKVIPCILADQKANQHTDSANQKTIANGCISEFVVDMKELHKNAKRDGSMSSVDNTFSKSIKKVRVYNY